MTYHQVDYGAQAQANVDRLQKRIESLGDFDRLSERFQASPLVRMPGQKYTYLYGIEDDGTAFFKGPMTEEEAEKRLRRCADGEIFHSNSRQRKVAVQEFKALLDDREIPASEALRRLRSRQKGDD